ncbi:methionine aminopeptidase 1D, mitochondrial-like [Dreissena polymorpha]|uniref:Methionine aminopeptidase n=1 Tax=Dreissena polymorpha TaxID=45954 RepID=A0A9D4ELH9_DREPO|nr:methionine aminopeptidase 1D, mitochondrial-like [Dreissena polymorpha]KAH3781816.1 hypothetical protein DPMN_159723 [Dreissena polymorpha]
MRVSSTPVLLHRLKSSFLKSVGRDVVKPTYSIVTPGRVSPARLVPDHIVKPSYAMTGELPERLLEPEIKTASEISGLRTSCRLAGKILNTVGKSIKVGMTTDAIDGIVHEECIKNNAYPSPLTYKGFPKSVCTSVNNVACHGIPDDRPLENGDIVNVDVSVYLCGYHGDTSETFAVGKVDKAGQQLLRVGRECLAIGIDVCRPGARFCDIGIAISEHAHAAGFTVIPQIIGHGIGTYFHGPPDIFHVDYITKETEEVMRPGMTFTIEPVICEGSERYKVLADGWTLVTLDNSRSCQFEHTVLITDTGVNILTKYIANNEET